MKILHTSDWHLGQLFMGQSREEEHKAFLNTLLEIIKKENIDLLLITGDIFDTATPPIYAQKLYFNFLSALKETNCRKCIITAGNHDSISFLESFKEILSLLSIEIVEKEGKIFEFEDFTLLAVPYLREKYITKFISDQNYEDHEKTYIKAIKDIYTDLYKQALKSGKKIVATGHLSVVEAKKSGSERELYIGNLSSIESSFFDIFDLTLLGHFHKAQKIGKTIYCGSPIPLSFNEAKDKKSIFIVDTKNFKIKDIEIKPFRKLIEIKGDYEKIEKELLETNSLKEAWCKIVIQGDKRSESFIQSLNETAKKKNIKILAIQYEKEFENILKDIPISQGVSNLSPLEIFDRKLKEEIEDRELEKKLKILYEKILREVETQEDTV